jgi:hypothetical protein
MFAEQDSEMCCETEAVRSTARQQELAMVPSTDHGQPAIEVQIHLLPQLTLNANRPPRSVAPTGVVMTARPPIVPPRKTDGLTIDQPLQPRRESLSALVRLPCFPFAIVTVRRRSGLLIARVERSLLRERFVWQSLPLKEAKPRLDALG